ncbi:MAG: hypothetical protein ACK5VE_01980 [Alphaproteobacteria bacterium]
MSRNEHSTNPFHRQRKQAGFMIALVAVLLVVWCGGCCNNTRNCCQ